MRTVIPLTIAAHFAVRRDWPQMSVMFVMLSQLWYGSIGTIRVMSATAMPSAQEFSDRRRNNQELPFV